jgi:hypothetical protein
MARFSVTDAVTSGFGVIGRAPLAVLAWGVVILVALVAPLAMLAAAIVPQFIQLFAAMPPPGAVDDTVDPALMAQMLQLQGGMMGVNLVSWLGGTLVKAVIAAAVFRAVLEPDQKRFGYLRLGAREGWLALVMLVEAVLVMIVYFASVMIVMIVGMIIYLAGSQMGEGGKLFSGALVGLLVLAAIGAFVWAWLRLSMAGPMTFAERRFQLFESWTFTRGQSWRLLGLAALLVLIIIVIEAVAYAIAGVGAFAAWGRIAALGETLRNQPPQTWVRTLWPIAATVAVIGSFVGAAVMAVVYAPWATAYKELAASRLTPPGAPHAA